MTDDLISPLSPVPDSPAPAAGGRSTLPVVCLLAEIPGITQNGRPVALMRVADPRDPSTVAAERQMGGPPGVRRGSAGGPRHRIPLVHEMWLDTIEIWLSDIPKRTQPITEKGLSFQNAEIVKIAEFLVEIAKNEPKCARKLEKCEKLAKFAFSLIK